MAGPRSVRSLYSQNGAVPAQRNNSAVKLGVFASVLIVLFTMAYSSFYDVPTYTGWVAFVWMTAVPAQIIFSLHMHFASPRALANLSQPKKGLAYAALTLVLMLLGGAYLYLAPGGMTEPGPFLIMATITTVVATFWLVVAWQCWPFTLMTRDPFKQGLLAFVAAYALGYAVYQLCFDFTFMAGAPVYIEALDPKGAFGAWLALAFGVTTVAVMMAMSLFEFWPCTKISAAQPRLGVAVTLLNLVVSAGFFWLAVFNAGMDPVDYMVRMPVSIIFGIFLVSNMMQFQLFSQLQQPIRGAALLATLILAYGMQLLYRAAIPYVVGVPLHEGAPTYAVELWVATALLGITFPVINLVSGYFAFWPLKRDE